MTQNATIQIIPTAMNTEGADTPEWVQLTPAGPDVVGRDGRAWKMQDPQAVVDAFVGNGADLPVDFEHATQIKGAKGEAAPAVGWIKELAVRGAAIWGRVEWNHDGAAAVTSKGYRYISPVFTFTKSARTIAKMVSAGLTNQPNLHLTALNKQGQQEETPMDKEILKALNLPDGASAADALTAINKLQQDYEVACNRADTPDAAKFVPRADFDLAQNKVAEFEKAGAERMEQAINTEVDGAVEAGKIAPASREYHIAACKQEGGLDRFREMVKTAPQIARNADLGDATAANKGEQLNDEEIAVCRALGMTQEDFAKAKAENTNKEPAK